MIDREALARFLEQPVVRNGILAVIAFNAVILGLETSSRATEAFGPMLSLLDGICLSIYVVEILLKMIAYRWDFFKSGWNIFDFVIVAFSLMPTGGSLNVLRAARILRVLRAVSIAPSLRRVVEGLFKALPGMASVFMLMLLIFYIGAVMATKLYGAGFPEWFGTIGRSFFSLFQIMTLESWSMGIVRPVIKEYAHAWLFFVPFILITTFAVVNLVVGLVVNSMQEVYSEEADAKTQQYRDEVAAKLARIEKRLDALALDQPEHGGREPAGDEGDQN